MDYFEKRSYSVKRELINITGSRGTPSFEEEHTYPFETFAEAFNCFNKMYEMDSAIFWWINENRSGKFCDQSKNATSYSFTVGDRMVMVKILDVNEIAKEVFGI